MLKHILPNIPKEHSVYTECFFGGGAVFWAKEPSKVEVINDLNGSVANFYRQLKESYEQLNLLVQGTLHSRKDYKDARVIYENPHLFDDVRCAWAFWMLTQQGFLSKIGSWGYSKKKDSVTTKIRNKKLLFTKELAHRLDRTQIECNDAVKVIQSRDMEGALHFIDPPYINTNMGHYSGYNLEDYTKLLEALTTIKGKFILASFETDVLNRYSIANGWYTMKFVKNLDASSRKGAKKVEVLTANYPIE